MPTRPFPLPALLRPARRRGWLSLWLVLALLAAPWQPQALARSSRDIPAMAICSVGGSASGNAPLHAVMGHCGLCCSGQPATSLPPALLLPDRLPGLSYPLSAGQRGGSRLARVTASAQARAPPR